MQAELRQNIRDETPYAPKATLTRAERHMVSLGLLGDGGRISDRLRAWALYSFSDLSRCGETVGLRLRDLLAFDKLSNLPDVGE